MLKWIEGGLDVGACELWQPKVFWRSVTADLVRSPMHGFHIFLFAGAAVAPCLSCYDSYLAVCVKLLILDMELVISHISICG